MRSRISSLLILMFILVLTMQCANEAPQTDIEEKNKAMVRDWFEKGWNKHNPDIITEYFTDNFFNHDLNFNRDALKQFVSSTISAFPDIHFTIDDQIAEGDMVATRWTFKGTHNGEFFGVAATGKEVTVSGVNISRHIDGKYVEDWGHWDGLGAFQQLGEYPPIIENE